MNLKKITKLTMLAIIAIGVVFPIDTLASNDNYEYSFTIGPFQMNSWAPAGRYRQTTNTKNPWKVKLNSSTEGVGTITRFWLEKENRSNVSPAVNIKQGNAATYTNAYSSASQTYVWLTAENNNINGNTYIVKGIWDEETH